MEQVGVGDRFADQITKRNRFLDVTSPGSLSLRIEDFLNLTPALQAMIS